ncbi:c8863993-2c4a-42fc-b28b-7164c0d5ba6c [Thermothielavioides terrestris]|uniref:C8863993-2c4a-42fc-b28b-7164c0d5ba6c n=1 Tax=Thermothielavioides terrestris TaxID=2587410 RepID=A0A3S4AQ73_9PEZI|nr:c8863993-2c4a-42fc-b28b-7164c0d5ba6c [Thermothielavioides terrestris]
MSSTRDTAARLRAGLNPLMTASLGALHGHNTTNTPVSALSVSSNGAFSSAQTPLSAIQPYNPQEWLSSPSANPAPDRMPHSQPAQPAQPFQEPQTPPLPPPPYSPPRSARPMSMVFDQTQAANVSVARAPPPPVQRVAIEPPVPSPSFPPPPSGRGGSRERRFGLPSLGRRRETEHVSAPVEQAPQHRSFGLLSRTVANNPAPLTLQIPPRTESDTAHGVAPGARRAASTPAPSTPTSARSRSSSQVRWDPSMPLPPPPPGPPPSASRSQSAQRSSSGSEPVVSPPTRRPPPSGVSALGPVPPTPANWRDGDSMPGPAPPRTESPNAAAVQAAPPTENASVGNSNAGPPAESASSGSSGGGLTRSPAVRGEKTLLERRSESRNRAGNRNSTDASARPQPLSDIVIPGPSGGLQRRLTITRGTPRTARASETPRTADSHDGGQESRTPRADGSGQVPSGQVTPTVLSPSAGKQPERRQALAPKALPTPPTGSRSSSSHRGSGPDVPSSAPLSPALPLTKEAVITQSTEQFCRGTIERFTAFAQKEAAAANDAERVRLFAEFFVSESRIRRERYGAAIGAMGSEILDLTRDLFRPMPSSSRRESTNSFTSGTVELTPQSSEPRSHRGSIGSALGGTTPTSNQQTPPSPGPPGGQNWQSSNFMPSLSPILSMSISDAVDEEDSRGRPASRWWESDSAGGPGPRIERSKRESKYMGVPKEAREALQWTDDPHPSPGAGSSKRTSYPPEKTGWHDQDPNGTPQALSRSSLASSSVPSAPTTPNPDHLDVSRLVTLPPPYPRHHPAVNNNHPELAQTRSAVRAISDMSEIDGIKERFKQGSAQLRAEAADTAKKRRQALRQHLQEEIASGAIGYAEAAAIEADAKAEEHAALKELEKKDFETFQTAVVMPVNEILQTRIGKATELFSSLRSRLFDETHESNPNLPQEEGDEQPELLEKLTLLKWIFEAREALHRGLYDLLTDRNDRYRDMVLVPYRLAGQADKVASAEAFFAEDGAQRALAFAEEALRRTQEFRDVVEETVARGVEVQLNAFWDIAPPLKRLLDKIPAGDLDGFSVQIPAAEYAENPAYHDHPLQYLFSLLLHAEKSTYQFIESQTNLLCLLHEVREACVSARARVMEADGRDPARIEEMKAEEGRRLTDDLKEKVRVVQDQWNSALGETVGSVKERVGGWLLETGGWDESFEEGGVGGV